MIESISIWRIRLHIRSLSGLRTIWIFRIGTEIAVMGIDMVIGRVLGDYRITPIELMGREVLPAVAEL
jgi:hypothetical protein